jgi:hypothetical protein
MYQDFENYSNTQVISDLSDFVSQDFKRADTKRIFNSLNLVYQPVKKLEITGNLVFNKNKNTFSDGQNTIYFPDSLTIKRESKYLNKPQTLYGLLKLKYDLAENMQLEYQGKADWDEQAINNQLFDTENFLHSTKEKAKFLFNDINLTVANKDSSAFIFNISSRNNRNSQQFDYLKIEDNEQKINQYMQATNAQYNISAKYTRKNSSRFSYFIQPVFSLNEQQIGSNVSVKNDTTSDSVGLRDISLIFNVRLAYYFGKSSILFSSGVGYSKQLINQLDKYRFEFSPKLVYQFTSGDHSISLSADYSKGKYDLLKYVGYYSGYRDKNEKSRVYTYGSEFSWGGMYNYFSTFNQTYFLLMYTNSINYNDFTDRMDISPEINHYYSIVGQSRKTQLVILQFRKYFDPIRHNFQIDNTFIEQKYSNYLNSNDLRKVQNYSNNLRFSVKSIFDIPFEYSLGINLKKSAYKTDISASISNFNYAYFQYLVYKPTKNMKMGLRFDEYFLGKDNQFYLFIRPDITCSLEKCRLSIRINAYNILNNKQITDYRINDYSSTEEYYGIVPAQYLLNVQFQF